MNDRRRGEKLGWTLGLLGSTVWMLLAAACELIAGDPLFGSFALAAASCVVAMVILLAPWRHPSTRFWMLFLPPISVIVVVACVLASRQPLPHFEGRAPVMVLLLMLGMILGVGRRRWEDGEATEPAPKGRDLESAASAILPIPFRGGGKNLLENHTDDGQS